MKNVLTHAVLSLVTSIIVTDLFGQDTLYADAYPSGIVSNNYVDRNFSYEIYPIENPQYRIKFNKKELQKVIKNGQTISNPEYDPRYFSKSKMVALSTEPTTGKIFYTNVIENSSATKEQLYSSLIGLRSNPKSLVNYRLLSESPTSFDYLSYEVTMNAKYAGDDALIEATLGLHFKDGKMKYEIKGFHVTIGIKKKLPWQSSQSIALQQLERYYPQGRSDSKKFWIPISKGIASILSNVEDNIRTARLIRAKKNDW